MKRNRAEINELRHLASAKIYHYPRQDRILRRLSQPGRQAREVYGFGPPLRTRSDRLSRLAVIVVASFTLGAIVAVCL